jgi:hypothetical protein
VSAEVSRVMASMGRRGGKVSGERRMINLTPSQRTEIASQAAKERWRKAKGLAE